MQTDIYCRAYQQSDKMGVASLMMELQIFHDLERFPKSVKRFSDKKRGVNNGLEC